MQDLTNEPQENQTQEQSSRVRTRVGFPEPQTNRGVNKKLIFLVSLIIVALAIAAWFFLFKEESPSVDEISPTPTLPASSPTPEPPETVNKQEIKIQVLNGTGLSGAAGSLKGQLEKAGYTDIKVGNAGSQDFSTTEVVFSTRTPASVRDEIMKLLQGLYNEVETSDASQSDSDVIITTGYPKGHTPTPTAKPKATSTPTPTAGATSSPTPTTTITLTPTTTPAP